MSRRVLVILAGLAALVLVLVIGLSQTKTDNAKPKPASISRADALRALAGAPAPLAALHRQADALLESSPSKFKAVLAGLRGHPVVVNKWASWCGPCRAEFPFLQRAGVRFGKRVAFVGLNSGDSTTGARDFLARFPVSYPSYTDPREKVALSIGASTGYPITVFYDAKGHQQYLHAGSYPSEAKLAQDIQRYALGHA